MSADDRNEELENEEPYVKADHRASRRSEEETPQRETASAQEETPKAEKSDEGEPPDIDVYSLLRMSVGMFVEQAWIHLGLRMAPNKTKIEQNLPQAKVAIDTVDFMIRQLEPDLDESEKRELDVVLANLRMNYVQRV